MFSIEDINEMQKTIERKDRIIKVLKERVRQWVKEYNILDEIIEMYKMSENETDRIIAELQAYRDVNEDFKQAWEERNKENEKLKQTLQQIKEIAERIAKSKIDRYPYGGDEATWEANLAKQILQLIGKAEEE